MRLHRHHRSCFTSEPRAAVAAAGIHLLPPHTLWPDLLLGQPHHTPARRVLHSSLPITHPIPQTHPTAHHTNPSPPLSHSLATSPCLSRPLLGSTYSVPTVPAHPTSQPAPRPDHPLLLRGHPLQDLSIVDRIVDSPQVPRHINETPFPPPPSSSLASARRTSLRDEGPDEGRLCRSMTPTERSGP